MMDYIINWALRNRSLTLACAVILLGVGIYNSLVCRWTSCRI
jgi:Cu/Ag efflux pump CusA